jgi:hypothetical protein
MATQVNFAANYIKNKLCKDMNKAYIHIINIDSRISKESLNEAFSAINE